MASFPVTILKARVPMCKTFRSGGKEPYPNVKDFKSFTKQVGTIEQFYQLIKDAALEGACLLKGELDQPLEWESRAGHTTPDKPTFWVCLDLDYLPSIATIDDFLSKIGIPNTSYILQWSASYGVHGNFAIRAHLFFMLDQPYSPSVLKLWLKQLNLQTFPTELVLTRTDVALRWGLDITTCQSDKLIYITPPTCHPTSLNHFQGERITLVKKANDLLSLPKALLTVAQIQALEEAKIDELRKAKGLEARGARGFAMKEYKNLGIEYLSKPDRATVTGAKVDEQAGFVRLNINGGDSWAYYHPIGKPELIYNFKGEPVYLTKELDPDYWYRSRAAVAQAVIKQNKGKLILGFRDFKTGGYYNGWYDQDADEITLYPARNEKQINDFYLCHGQLAKDSVPIWNIVYDPMAGPIDIPSRTINFFRLSKYMREAQTRETHQPFPNINRIFTHVVGQSCLNHFYNWLAFIYQKRVAPGTAWVWHGTQGTGKGLILNRILKMLFGPDNVLSKRMEELEDKFNGYLENCLICFIDEAQVSESGRNKVIMANLKNQITEPTISIRRMHTNGYSVTNRVGWIFASNMPDPVVVTANDRRFNIAEFQAAPLPMPTAEVIDAIEAELTDFATYLRLYQVDEKAAREVLKNSEREQMILISQQSADTLANQLMTGRLSELWDALPTSPDYMAADNKLTDAYFSYKKLLFDIVRNGRNRITRDELHTIFNFCVGNVPSQPNKLTSYLKHHGVEVKNIRDQHNNVVKGVTVTWNETPEWFADRRAEIFRIEQPALKVVK